MATSQKQLNNIREMIKSGKRNEAVNRLVQLIERDHDNTELWWLLANATTDTFQARLALEELLSINPNDERAKKMLTRLETRDVLNQMGVTKSQSANNQRGMFLAGFLLALVVGVLLFMGLTVLNNANTPVEVVEYPTRYILPTETPTPLPTATNTATAIPTDAPTAVPTSTEVIEVDANPPATNVSRPTTAPETTEAVLPPIVETTEEVTVFTRSEPDAIPTSMDGVATISVDIDSSNTQSLPSESVPARAVSEMRGQVLNMQPRQEIIDPYGEHGYTFSGYRDEAISLELINITGQGNPSLELRDADGNVIAQDIDTRSGNNTDAIIEVTLPADGIYTVVVRMASTDEQLYYLNLSRVSTP